MKKLFLIDANSIIHRSFHALPPFTSPSGLPTGALYGLSSILLKLFREEKPDYAAALFDRPEPTFRKKKYREYKAQRPPAPDALISQIIEAHELFGKFGVRTFEKPGFEADDLIATLSEKFSAKGGSPPDGRAGASGGKGEPDVKIVILTGDRDTLQLVSGKKIIVRLFKKGISDTEEYDEDTIMEKYNLRPSQLIDYKALVGDPSDNIKGVTGVGPKTAEELLARYGSIEGVFLPGNSGDAKLKKILPLKETAILAKELVALNKNVPIESVAIDDLRLRCEENLLKDYFLKFGFKTLVGRLEKEVNTGDYADRKQGIIL